MNPTLKAIFFSAVVAVTAFIAVLSTSCNKNKCNGIICANDGVCNNGVCTCPYGYEGPTCERLTRQKFTGNFMVFEKGSASLAHQYPIHIIDDTAGPLPSVLIYNCYNYFRQPIKAYAQGDTLIIPNQQLEGKIIYGEGIIAYDVTYAQYGNITMRYVVQDTASDVTDDYGYETYADHSDPSSWNK